MNRRRAPIRPQAFLRHRSSQERVVLVGTLLVLALVAMLPLALALVTASGGAADVGVGSGAGELSAAALSALHRDLNGKRAASDLLPDPTDRIVPHLFSAHVQPRERPDVDVFTLTATRAEAPLPEPAPTGPGPNGIPLRL